MPIKQCNLYLSEIHFTVITMDFGEVVGLRVKSKFTGLRCPVDIYIALLWHTLYSSLFFIKCLVFTAANALVAVAGTLKTRDWKTRDHKNTGVENAGLENVGPNRRGGKDGTGKHETKAHGWN